MNLPLPSAEEAKRLAALDSYHILDTLPEEDFDAITSLASQICQTPISLITLVDDTRQWFKSAHGLSAQETPREGGFCTYTVSHPLDLSIVEDARVSEQFSDHPLVTGDPRIVFYAGAPLVDDQGFAIGSLCVIDTQARPLSQAQQAALKQLARQVVNLLTLRKQNNNLKQSQTLLQLEQMALAQSEARFRTLIEEAPIATSLFLGREFRVAVANQPMLAIWGKGPNQVGRTIAEILPEIANQPFLAILDNVYTSGQTYSAKGARADLLYDGVLGRYYFDFTYKPLVDSSGQVYGILQMAAEVTNQVLAQQQMDEAQEQMLASFEQSPVAIALMEGPDLTFRQVNQRYERLVGRSAAQLMGQGLIEALPELAGQGFDTLLQQVMASGEAFSAYGQAVQLTQQQQLETIYVDFTYQPRRRTDGRITGVLVIATEVTQQVLAQKRIDQAWQQMHAQLEDRVEQRTQELTLANQDLQRSNDNLQQFAYVASHDLQEPLRKIQSFASLITERLAGQADASIQMYLDRISAAGAHMSTLMQDLLTFSRISIRQQTFGPVSLEGIVGNVLTLLDWEIGQRGAQLQVEALPIVRGDETQLSQLFQNLLTNALKFVPIDRTPQIRIQYEYCSGDSLPPQVHPTSQTSFYHQINVSDNGIGFDMRFVNRIFQVFQRLHSKDQYAGTGVGLAIAQRVVDNHGGAITASSQPEQGATFYVYLPA